MYMRWLVVLAVYRSHGSRFPRTITPWTDCRYAGIARAEGALEENHLLEEMAMHSQ